MKQDVNIRLFSGTWMPCLVFIIMACASTTEHYQVVQQQIQIEDYHSALKTIQKSKAAYPERNEALYHMEEGIVAHFGGQYKDSNQSLAKAELILDELYTRSISKEAASFLINDNTIPYHGEDFEHAMVNLFMALNYVALGLNEDALVEARKVDTKLNVINSRYEEDQKNVYREDAFIRFLMGVLYEMDGEINDAFISYRKAEQIYRTDFHPNYGINPPRFLIENLLTSAGALDFAQELSEFKQRYPQITYLKSSVKQDMAEVYYIQYNGVGAEKIEKFWIVPMPDGYIAKIAYPEFEKRPFEISHAVITLKRLGTGTIHRFNSHLMEDISAVAEMNLDNRILRIKAKAIARATSKYALTKVAAKQAEKESGNLAGLLVQAAGNIVSFATENADVRHWRLLPAEIRVGRAVIPPGKYAGTVDYIGKSGTTLASKQIDAFTVLRGTKKFIVQRTAR
jgi:hypothetical protein